MMLAGRILLFGVAVVLCAFTEVEGNERAPWQPGDEREVQSALPQSNNPLWRELAKCKVGFDDAKGLYSITVVPEVKALAGKTLTLSGFILPLDGNDKTKHFLLTKRTPVCFFCPPGGPNEVVEVKSKTAVDWREDIVKVQGRFTLVNDGEKGVFFALLDADRKD